MNFLAHIYLSGNDPMLTIGNFIGDFVKGKELEKFPNQIQKGIRLHRKIDEYTDSHPIVLASKIRLRPDYRHYAPVIVDVFYDHFLAKLWADYHPIDLIKYTQDFYAMIRSNENLLPPKAKHMFSYMSAQNWLYEYQYLEGINRALTGMSHRTTFQSGMETATQALKENYLDFESEFKQFFPLLQRRCQQFLDD